MKINIAGLCSNKKNILIAAAVLILAAVFLSEMIPSGDKASAKAVDFDADAYLSKTETKLQQIISRIDGAGETMVMLTLESGAQTVYAEENQSSTEIDNSISGSESSQISSSDYNYNYLVVKDGSGAEMPVALSVRQPQFRGAVILCEGADSAGVREKVLSAARAALDVSTNKISINKLSRR